jgi:hypothetical protein
VAAETEGNGGTEIVELGTVIQHPDGPLHIVVTDHDSGVQARVLESLMTEVRDVSRTAGTAPAPRRG